MHSKRYQSTKQPAIASALLAVAFVVVSSRERAYTEADMDRIPLTQRNKSVSTTQPQSWYDRFAHAFDRRLIRLFHCALPSGLEPKDFDLSDL